jgi:hypothetical protein
LPNQAETVANSFKPAVWKVGQHVAAVGDTGSGKTYLVAKLVQLRRYVVVLRTKPDDIKFEGFRTVRKAEAMDNVYAERLLLTPKYEHQIREIGQALENAWIMGNWTIVVDELWYVEKQLRLGGLVERLLTQGRSKGISVIVGMQRPAQISRFAISQCTHLFTFRVEGRDLDTIKLSTTPRIVAPVDRIRGHKFVYFNRSTREIAIGDAKTLDRVITAQIPRGGT